MPRNASRRLVSMLYPGIVRQHCRIRCPPPTSPVDVYTHLEGAVYMRQAFCFDRPMLDVSALKFDLR